MNSSKTVTATFTRIEWTLTVSHTGGGTVTSVPAGIFCGAACTAVYLDGTSVSLTATPSSGYRFAGWSGACTGTGAPAC